VVQCPVCGGELSPPTVRCSRCDMEVHRKCAKKRVGRWYCRRCYKEAKKEITYEKMARRADIFGRGKFGGL